MPVDSTLRAARERLIHDHVACENAADVDAVLRTFKRPRYELIATGEVLDGEAAVRAYHEEAMAGFSQRQNRILTLHHADDAVVAEIEASAVHTGRYRGLPATGQRYSVRMVNIFTFEGAELVGERMYLDLGTIQRQLGLAHSPFSLPGRLTIVLSHPLTMARAAWSMAKTGLR